MRMLNVPACPPAEGRARRGKGVVDLRVLPHLLRIVRILVLVIIPVVLHGFLLPPVHCRRLEHWLRWDGLGMRSCCFD
jgi:hypothetical protein